MIPGGAGRALLRIHRPARRRARQRDSGCRQTAQHCEGAEVRPLAGDIPPPHGAHPGHTLFILLLHYELFSLLLIITIHIIMSLLVAAAVEVAVVVPYR